MAYLACKKGARQNFWHQLFSGWWEHFPWRLNDDEEPPTDNAAEMARLQEASPGEETQKSEVERRLQEVGSTFCAFADQVIDESLLHFSV